MYAHAHDADSYIHPITLLVAKRGEQGSTNSPRSPFNAIEWAKRGWRMQKTRRYVLIGSPACKEGGRGDGIKRIQKIKSIHSPPPPALAALSSSCNVRIFIPFDLFNCSTLSTSSDLSLLLFSLFSPLLLLPAI